MARPILWTCQSGKQVVKTTPSRRDILTEERVQRDPAERNKRERSKKCGLNDSMSKSMQNMKCFFCYFGWKQSNLLNLWIYEFLNWYSKRFACKRCDCTLNVLFIAILMRIQNTGNWRLHNGDTFFLFSCSFAMPTLPKIEKRKKFPQKP